MEAQTFVSCTIGSIPAKQGSCRASYHGTLANTTCSGQPRSGLSSSRKLHTLKATASKITTYIQVLRA